jgi:hypothetical protein
LCRVIKQPTGTMAISAITINHKAILVGSMRQLRRVRGRSRPQMLCCVPSQKLGARQKLFEW